MFLETFNRVLKVTLITGKGEQFGSFYGSIPPEIGNHEAEVWQHEDEEMKAVGYVVWKRADLQEKLKWSLRCDETGDTLQG